ncbi:MAG: hydroxymethylpyrimidine/phosphomethylpyrimidine kinase [Methylococcales bacterium]|jgi:hydroxymethylpyrimidine/phosphomethylpyrimidine kinase|nr:hydroxymethylpyrimidine/phosphomethylpyrimidine kinase [Methylococcales bacterium]MBT7445206.1 hydroxymethylpyrimidine/phosphomethylpyrimidine kinase [Methylococcales bacterium]
MSANHKKTILALSGFDPSGGAGLQADIETIGALGGHTTPVMTVNTVQNTHNVDALSPVDVSLFKSQLNKLKTDIQFSAIKIGLIGSIEIAECIAQFLSEHPTLPVVLDPVLASGAGNALATTTLAEYMMSHVIPQVTIITPNSLEARTLTHVDGSLQQAGEALLDTGCQYALITGTHEKETQVHHRLYHAGTLIDTQSCQRLPGEYHGSGCTLASAIAFQLTQHNDTVSAIHAAQEYTWQCLEHASAIGQGQLIPNRFHQSQ